MSVDPSMTTVLKNVERKIADDARIANTAIGYNALRGSDSLAAIHQDWRKQFSELAAEHERRINAYLEGFKLDRDTVLRKAG